LAVFWEFFLNFLLNLLNAVFQEIPTCSASAIDEPPRTNFLTISSCSNLFIKICNSFFDGSEPAATTR
jgi:hypothetical protein